MIDKEACKTREFPSIKQKMDLMDWQDTKEACIKSINAAHQSIQINTKVLIEAELKIKELLR